MKLKKYTHNAVCALLLFQGVLGMGQDATESPTSTIKGSFQGESGIFHEAFTADAIKTETYAIGATLLLYGITNTIEARFGWDYQQEVLSIDSRDQENGISGFSPLQLGGAIDIFPGKGILPQWTVLADIFLPFTAGTDLKTLGATTELRSIFYHTLDTYSNVSYNIGLQWGEGALTPIYTLAYNRNFTENFGFYAELQADFPQASSANHFWDLGITYLITTNLQFDTLIGTSITSGQDFFWGARLTYSTISQQYFNTKE